MACKYHGEGGSNDKADAAPEGMSDDDLAKAKQEGCTWAPGLGRRSRKAARGQVGVG